MKFFGAVESRAIIDTKENSAVIQDVTVNRNFANSIVLKSSSAKPSSYGTKIPASDSAFFSIKITQNTENFGIQFYQRKL